VFHLMTHAFFKALLFLGSGAVIHAMHHAYHATHSHADAQDMRNMGGLRRTCRSRGSSCGSDAGDLRRVAVCRLLLEGRDHLDTARTPSAPFEVWFRIFWIMAFAAALMTAFYMTRLMIMTFHGGTGRARRSGSTCTRCPPVMWVPLAILAVLSIVGGWINVPEADRADAGVRLAAASEWLHDWLHPVTERRRHLRGERRRAGCTLAVGRRRGVLGGGVVPVRDGGDRCSRRSSLMKRRYVPAEESPAAARLRQGAVQQVVRRRVLRRRHRPADRRRVARTLALRGPGPDRRRVNGARLRVARLRLGRLALQTGQLNTYAFAVVLGRCCSWPS
jgi:hypothetical protein